MYDQIIIRTQEIALTLIMAVSAFFQSQPAEAQVNPGLTENAGLDTISLQDVQIPASGLITGSLSYPSEKIPPLAVFAIRIDNGKYTYYSIQTEGDQSSYSIRVDPGVYQIVAYNADLAGGYTKFVECGMSTYCSDHNLLSVVIEAGDNVDHIDLLDWYAPRGTFPARPDESSQSETTPTCSTYHTVRWGESLFRIGLQYDLTWKPIASANNLSNPNLVFAGQVLCIPNGSSTNSVKTPTSNIPTFEILSVVRNKRVTIRTNNFPADTFFVATMGRYGTKGINGFEVATTDSGDGGSFTATYSIPQSLKGHDRIAIRLQSSAGYYSYNWFYNNSPD
jgi:hypothetical protein